MCRLSSFPHGSFMTVGAVWDCREDPAGRKDMDTERGPQFGRVRLPGSAESAATGEQAPEPDYLAPASPRGRSGKVGIHQVRRMSNWTAAALIVATGATTVALAHHAFPVGVPATAVASGSTS